MPVGKRHLSGGMVCCRTTAVVAGGLAAELLIVRTYLHTGTGSARTLDQQVSAALATVAALVAAAYGTAVVLRPSRGTWISSAGLALGITALAAAGAAPAVACLSPARLDGLPMPALPTSPERPEVHVVAGGDSLWSVAAARLPPRAAPEAFAQAWHRWYATNRAVIGPDPDLLVPGQRLRPPGPRHPRRHTP